MAKLSIKRGDSSVVIDSNYYNLGLRQKLQVQITTALYGNSTGSPCYTGKITVDSSYGILAFRCSEYCALWSSEANGAQTTYTFVVYGNPTVADIWLFDLPEYAIKSGTSKFILRRQADQKVVFDSRSRYLKVQDFTSTDNAISSSETSKDYPRHPATVMIKRAWTYQRVIVPGTGEQQLLWASTFVKHSGNRVLSGSKQYFAGRDQNPNNWYPSGDSNRGVNMVVDVENY